MTQRELDLLANRLEDVLGAHRCPARVIGATVTPRLVVWQVATAPGVRLDAVRAIGDDLARGLAVAAVRVGQSGELVTVEMPRDAAGPVLLAPLLSKLSDRPPVTAICGIGSDGAPLLLRLPSPDVAHVLIAGTTGSGKTVLLRSMVLSLAMRHAGGGLGLLLVDPRGGAAFGAFDGLPQLVAPVIREPVAAAGALGRLVAEMERRDRDGEQAAPLVLVIDELADLLASDRSGEAEGALTRLVARGRGAGIHVIAATQRPAAEAVSGMIRANFPCRIVGKVASPEDARLAAGQRGSGAESLAGRGDFVLVGAGQVLRFQAAYASSAEIGALVGRLGWATAHVAARPPAELPPAPQPVAGDLAQHDLAQLAAKLRPWWQEHGDKWGSKSRAVKLLWGESAKLEGHDARRLDAVLRYMATSATAPGEP